MNHLIAEPQQPVQLSRINQELRLLGKDDNVPGLHSRHFGQFEGCPFERKAMMKIGGTEVGENVVVKVRLDSCDSIQDSEDWAPLGAFGLQNIRCVLRTTIWIKVFIPDNPGGIPNLDRTENQQ